LNSDQAIEEAQQKLFNLEQQLYKEGARNFLFIDIPPMEKTPACEPIPFFVHGGVLSGNWISSGGRWVASWPSVRKME
jgi:hypothetical protein